MDKLDWVVISSSNDQVLAQSYNILKNNIVGYYKQWN